LNIEAGDVLEAGPRFVLQLLLIVGLGFGAIWLWPAGLFSRSVAAITFPQLLRAVSAPGLVFAAAMWLYLLLAPLLKRRHRGAVEAAPADAGEPADRISPPLSAPGYRSG